MSYFNPMGDIKDKRMILFQAMDNDEDNNLSFDDLFYFYSKYAFSITQLNEHTGAADIEEDRYSCLYSVEELRLMVSKILQLHDLDKDGMLSYSEYTIAVTDWDVKEFLDVYLL